MGAANQIEADRSSQPAISASGLWREFNDQYVLQDVAIELAVGQTLAVLGANGAGKSTLARILAGLLRPSAGEVSVLGSALPRQAWKIRGRVGYLGHSALLYRDLDSAENLGFQARLHGIDPDRVPELLETVGLAARSSTRVAEMSAGMVQRLAIARVLLSDPEVLILDEPTSHLDPDAAEAMTSLLGAPGRTRVLVSHDVESALEQSDQLLVLGPSGAPSYDGPCAGLAPDQVRSLYAGAALR